MKNYKQILKVSICLFLFSGLQSYTLAEPNYPQETVIYFGNGIWTDNKAAGLNLEKLKPLLRKKVSGTNLEPLISFEIAYNSPEGTLQDLAESFRQLVQLNYTRFWQMLAGIEPFPEEIQAKIDEISIQVAQDVLTSNPNIQEHVETYNKDLKECKRVVVVAHSQGNLFANIAYLGVEPTLIDAFGIISVGNPDSTVAGEIRFPDISYTNLNEDLLVAAIPFSLPGNVDNYQSGEKYSPAHGHNFIGNYLDPGHPAETKIVDDTVAMIEELLKFDSNDYCGWPVVYASQFSVVRTPYDRLDATSKIWDSVWQGAQDNSLILEYRLGKKGAWGQLNQQFLGTDVAFYHSGNSNPETIQLSPLIFINNNFGSFSQTIEVQPDDIDFGIPKGIQQYRMVHHGDVIDQFTIDYDQEPWVNIRTSRPVAESLMYGSQPIIEIPEL